MQYRNRTGSKTTLVTTTGAAQKLLGPNPQRCRVELCINANPSTGLATSKDDIANAMFTIREFSVLLVYDEMTHGNMVQKEFWITFTAASGVGILEVFTDDVLP